MGTSLERRLGIGTRKFHAILYLLPLNICLYWLTYIGFPPPGGVFNVFWGITSLLVLIGGIFMLVINMFGALLARADYKSWIDRGIDLVSFTPWPITYDQEVLNIEKQWRKESFKLDERIEELHNLYNAINDPYKRPVIEAEIDTISRIIEIRRGDFVRMREEMETIKNQRKMQEIEKAYRQLVSK